MIRWRLSRVVIHLAPATSRCTIKSYTLHYSIGRPTKLLFALIVVYVCMLKLRTLLTVDGIASRAATSTYDAPYVELLEPRKLRRCYVICPRNLQGSGPSRDVTIIRVSHHSQFRPLDNMRKENRVGGEISCGSGQSLYSLYGAIYNLTYVFGTKKGDQNMGL